MAYLNRSRKIMVNFAAKESAFATPQTPTSLIRVNSASMPKAEVQLINDQDHIGGTEEVSDQEVFARGGSMTFSQTRVKPHTLAGILAFGLGSTTTTTPAGATLTRKHTILPMTATALPSFTMAALLATGVQQQFAGCLVNSFTLGISSGSNRFVNLDAELLFSGQVSATTTSVAEVAEDGLNAGNTSAFYMSDGTFDGAILETLDYSTDDLTGTAVSWTTDLRSLTWNFNNNLDAEQNYKIGGGLYLSGTDRDGRTQTLELVKDAASTMWTAEMERLIAQTDLACQLKIRGPLLEAGFYYGINLIWPLIRYQDIVFEEMAGRLVQRITCQVMEHATYGSVRAYLYNAQTAYAA